MPSIRDHQAAIKTAQTLANSFAQNAAERDRHRQLPHAELQQLGQSGLLGITVPSAYGGAGLSMTTLATVIKHLSAGDSSLGQIPQGHFYILEAIRHDGTAAQQQHFFQRALAGDLFGNAFAEIGTKTAAACNTRIVRQADDYVINGQKFYSTGALFAQWIAVVGLDERDTLLMAIVPRDTAGLTIIDDWSGMGQRTTASGTVSFKDVRVSESAIIPHQQAFEALTTQMINAQLLHGAIDTGIAIAALEDTKAFVRQHSRPYVYSGVDRACDDPYILHEIGDVTLQVHVAEAMLHRAGEFCDAAAASLTEDTQAAAMIAVTEAIALAEKASLLATNKLFEVSGTKSTLAQFNHDRHWRNARTHTLHDPVRWKYHRIGNYYLNGVLPPRDR